MTFKEFLEKIPPSQWVDVSDVTLPHSSAAVFSLNIPQKIYLYCDIDKGNRFFRNITGATYIRVKSFIDIFLDYGCCNCGKSYKSFSLNIRSSESVGPGQIFKYGELPPFRPRIPTKTITLIGPDKHLFLTGRRAENQGMGIGALSYYMRVVENQKNRIFDEIIRVIGKTMSPDEPVIQELENAKKEPRFTRAVETIKQALPQSLFINGKNPLTLLHSSLSQGVHDRSDAECLELASSIRTVLIEFAERLGQVLKEKAKLDKSINKLRKLKQNKKKKDS